jgi:hypothetical protein
VSFLSLFQSLSQHFVTLQVRMTVGHNVDVVWIVDVAGGFNVQL